MPPKGRQAGAKKVRRKEKKNVAAGHAHIKSTFNNTIVTITDPVGRGDLVGQLPAPSASRARASPPPSPLRWPPRPPGVGRWSTA